MELEVRRVLSSFRRHWLGLTIFSLAAAAAGYYFTYLLAEKYEATALVMVRPEEPFSIRTTANEQKELLNVPISAGQSTIETPMNTYLEIIASRVMAERVVRALGLDIAVEEVASEAPASDALSRLKDWAMPYLDRLKAYARDAKNILYHGRRIAPASALDSAIDKYLENISLDAVQDTHLFQLTFASESPQQAAAVATKAAELFLDFMVEMNTKEGEGTLRFMAEQVAGVEREMADKLKTLRIFKQKEDVVSLRDETMESIRVIADLEVELEKTNARLAGLLATRVPSNPDVLALTEEKNHLESALAEIRRELNQRTALEQRLVELELDVNSSEETYKFLKEEYAEAKVVQAKRNSEMRIVSHAAVPHEPAEPIRIYYAGIAFFVALMIGAHFIGIRELADTTIRSVDDVERSLGLPVLATIPQSSKVLASLR